MPNRDLYRFVQGCIRSVWALEVLLVLRRDRARAWTVEALVRELRASAPLVHGVLATFEAAGLARNEPDAGWLYAPASPALDGYCDELEQAYRERPVAVVNAIVASSTDDLASFADAFRFRGIRKP